MYNGYHLQNNRHALQQLIKSIYIPDITCGIGEAGETLTAMTMRVYYPQKQQSVVVPELSKSSYEQASIDGQGQKLNIEDFPTDDFYIGNPLGDPLGGV